MNSEDNKVNEKPSPSPMEQVKTPQLPTQEQRDGGVHNSERGKT